MVIDHFTRTFLNFRGLATRKNFITGITLAILFEGFQHILSWRAYAVNSIVETSNTGGQGLMGILDMMGPKVNTYGLNIFPINASLTFLTLYIVFIVTIKYCRRLSIDPWKGYMLGGIVTAFFWFTDSYVVQLSQFISAFDGGYLSYMPVSALSILLLVTGIATISYLYTSRDGKSASATKSEKDSVRLLYVSILFTLTPPICSFLISNQLQLPVGWIEKTALLLLFIATYLFIVYPQVKKTWNRLPNVYLIAMLFVTIEALYIVSGCWEKLSGAPLFVVNTLTEFIEYAFLIWLMALIIPLGVSDPSNEETSVGEAESDISDSLFQNKMFDSLFSYKGKITTRNYRAMLIFIFICANASFFPLIQFVLTDPGIGIFHIKYWHGAEPFGCFYFFVTLYSTFVVTIKRARAKSLPPVVGVLGGVITYLMFWCWQQILPVLTMRDIHFGHLSSALITTFAIIGVVGIITVILFAFYCHYDSLHKEEEKEGSFTSIRYLLSACNLFIAALLLRGLIAFIGGQYPISDFVNVILAIGCLGFVLSFVFSRATDAAISYWWILGTMLCIVLLEVGYYFTGSFVFILMLESVFLLRLALILAPSIERKRSRRF